MKLLTSTLEFIWCQDNDSRPTWTKCILKLDSLCEYTSVKWKSISTAHIHTCSIYVEIENHSTFQSTKLSFKMETEYDILVKSQKQETIPVFRNAMGLPHIHRISLLFCNTDMLLLFTCHLKNTSLRGNSCILLHYLFTLPDFIMNVTFCNTLVYHFPVFQPAYCMLWILYSSSLLNHLKLYMPKPWTLDFPF